ncbi:hypothetical protein ACF1AY_26080 [Streptomyces sp. NPDC014776]|uniref:hypothetical protein n=1 Tax=unclassified Streptomyces TaxID=2593676 RepID=UPI0036FED792
MEQRMSSSSQPLKAEPVTGAGFDPAHVPGITPPVSGPAPAAEPDPTEEETRAEETSDTAETAEASEALEAEEAAPAEAAEPPADGPVFEAADRRARIVADHAGVRLSLDDQACEFRWDEIGAVETETARFGKRFTITVHTPDRRWYPIEIDAPSRSDFARWEAELDAVLDAYFEDGDESKDSAQAGEEAE